MTVFTVYDNPGVYDEIVKNDVALYFIKHYLLSLLLNVTQHSTWLYVRNSDARSE